MMKHFVEVANNNYFKYDLVKFSDKIQYTVYDEKNSHYSWHTDITEACYSEYDNHVRKLSISLILSDPSEYEGGEFQIMHMGDKKMTTLKPPMGTAIIFSSTTRHRVRPIKSGKRISLVAWMGGPSFR
jgi:PKHD-type hydroxylase